MGALQFGLPLPAKLEEGFSRALGPSLRFSICTAAFYQKVLMTRASTVVKLQAIAIRHGLRTMSVSSICLWTKRRYPLFTDSLDRLLGGYRLKEHPSKKHRLVNGEIRIPKIVFPKRTPFEKIRSGIELFFSLINASKNELRAINSVYQWVG